MDRIKEIDAEIVELKTQLDMVTGTKTEVYSRIVGYYRALDNWNKGKSEEYVHRLTFGVPDEENITKRITSRDGEKSSKDIEVENPVRYELFVRQTCPNCPSMKDEISGIETPGIQIDVDTSTGTNRAIELSIYATPTAVFFDDSDREVARATTLDQLRTLFAVSVA